MNITLKEVLTIPLKITGIMVVMIVLLIPTGFLINDIHDYPKLVDDFWTVIGLGSVIILPMSIICMIVSILARKRGVIYAPLVVGIWAAIPIFIGKMHLSVVKHILIFILCVLVTIIFWAICSKIWRWGDKIIPATDDGTSDRKGQEEVNDNKPD